MNNVVNIAEFDTIIEANISMGRLKAEGIPCWLADEHLIQTDMLLIPALGGIKLQVPVEFAEQARSILAEDYSGLTDTYMDNTD